MNQDTVLQLYETHRHTIYRICLFYMKNEPDALDAMQNTLIRLLEYDRSFESGEHARNWLIRVAVNECKRSLSHWWRRTVDIDSYDIPAENDTDTYVRRQWIADSLNKLSGRCRLILYLFYFEGFSTAEIASLLSMKESTVRSCLSRGRKKLKLELERV